MADAEFKLAPANSGGRETTLHQHILDDIEGRIMSGAWPPGHRIPFEVDLARHYDCSRMTVNKVLTQLAKAGLVERIKRSGTFVRQPQAQSAVLEIHDIRKEVEQLKLPYQFAVTRQLCRKAKAADGLLLDVSPGSPILDLTCIHLASDQPFCSETRLINLAAVPEAEHADFSAVSPGQWLIKQVPWSSAEHRIQAVAADAATAALLNLPQGTACLVIERRTWKGALPVTHVRFTYPGDRHALVARFTPAS